MSNAAGRKNNEVAGLGRIVCVNRHLEKKIGFHNGISRDRMLNLWHLEKRLKLQEGKTKRILAKQIRENTCVSPTIPLGSQHHTEESNERMKEAILGETFYHSLIHI